jgi:serine protease Do
MTMKNFGSLIAAAVLGSTLTVGSFQLFTNTTDPIRIEHVDGIPAVNTSYTKDLNSVPLDFTEAAEKVMNAVVHIRSTQTTNNYTQNQQQLPEPFKEFFGPYLRDNRGQRGPRVGSGSGVIINDQGYIVTNNHVVDQTDDLEVTLHDNRTFKAKVIGTDPTTDLAVIQIEEKGLPYLALSDSDKARVGQWVLAVGNPFNLNSTVTAGIISAKARNIGIIGDSTSIESFIQTDAAVNPGNSGGALVNLNGDLVGINTAIASPTGSYSGYSFAIPSNIVSKVVEDLISYGVVQRGWLGVIIQSVSSPLVRENDLAVNEGAYVAGLADKSGAKDVGVKQDDVIIKIDEMDVKTTANLIGYVGSKRPGDKVKLKINRAGKEIEYEVLLKNREGNIEIVEKDKTSLLTVLGAELQEIDTKTLKRLGIESGVLVKSLRPGKIRKYTDMKEGFIITKIDGQKIRNKEDIETILKNKEGGILIEGIYQNGSGTYYYGLGV